MQKYRARISGPLLDRIDLQVDVPVAPFDRLVEERRGEASSTVRERVQRARQVQLARFQGTATRHNGMMTAPQIDQHCALTPEGIALLRRASEKLGLSARAHSRVLKVARTIADLAGAARVEVPHVAEAIQYRKLDRE